MSTGATIAAILFGSFGLKPPTVPPTPVGPERFLTLTAAPLRPVAAFHPDRLLIAGAITPTTRTRRHFR